MPNNKNLKPSKRSYDDLYLAEDFVAHQIHDAKHTLRSPEQFPRQHERAKDQLRAYSFILNLLEEKERRMNSQLIVAKYGKITNYAKHVGVAESYVHALIHDHISNPNNELYKLVKAEIAELKNNLE